MKLINKLFKSKPTYKLSDIPITVDMHSHLLPGLDDGVQDMDESLEMIRQMKALGYRKLITTPHVMGDFYKNDPAIIQQSLEAVQEEVHNQGIDVTIEAGGEYFIDEWFLDKIKHNNVMSFGDHFVLVETSFMNRPEQLLDTLFQVKVNGYKPIFAHPERYLYLYEDFEKFKEIYDKGVYFQINLNSLAGYYSPDAKYFAEQLIKHQMVDFVGSDAHRMNHLRVLETAMKSRSFPKLKELNLLNEKL